MATKDETIGALRIALRDCADDLEAELAGRYWAAKDHPALRRKYERDMQTVRNARLLLRASGE